MKKAIPILMSTSLVFAAIAPSVSAATNTEKSSVMHKQAL